MPRLLLKIVSALLFVTCFVTLAKASQYAAVARLASVIGFEAASLFGLTPVIVLAFVVDRKRRLVRLRGALATPAA